MGLAGRRLALAAQLRLLAQSSLTGRAGTYADHAAQHTRRRPACLLPSVLQLSRGFAAGGASPATVPAPQPPAKGDRKAARQEKMEGKMASMGRISSQLLAQRGIFKMQNMASPDMIIEPYRGDPPRLPVSSWFTLSGWREIRRRFLHQFKSVYTLHKCRQNIKGAGGAKFGLRDFKQTALSTYIEVCRALAAGDQSQLRQATTPAVFSTMKGELQRRRAGGWQRVEWAMKKGPALHKVEVLQGRIIAVNPRDDSTAWVQMTVRIPSQQTFAAFDARGRCVQGNPAEGIEVDDVWVLERALKQGVSSRWRVAGRLGSMATISAQTGKALLARPLVAEAAAAAAS